MPRPDWQSIVSSANSGFGSLGQQPERDFGGQQTARRGEHGTDVPLRVSNPAASRSAVAARLRSPRRLGFVTRDRSARPRAPRRSGAPTRRSVTHPARCTRCSAPVDAGSTTERRSCGRGRRHRSRRIQHRSSTRRCGGIRDQARRVRHLVALEPSGGEAMIGVQVAIGLHVRVGGRDRAIGDAPLQGRARLDHQSVHADVRRVVREHVVERGVEVGVDSPAAPAITSRLKVGIPTTRTRSPLD